MSTSITAPAAWANEPRLPGPVATTREVWRHRRFVKYLGMRALQKLYARTALGWIWILILPLFPILIRVLVFGGLLGMRAEGVPYFLFLTIGTASWNFFASALMWTTRGLELNREVLSHVYIPKVILPIATMTPAVFDLFVHLCVLLLAVVFYWIADGTPHVSFGLHTLWSVAALAFILLLVLGIGFFTSVWGEKARDVRFTIAQLTAVWFLVTPILYPVSAIPERYQSWLYANPMAAFVEAFKYGLLGTAPPEATRFAVAAAGTITAAAAGLFFFTRRTGQEEEI